MSRSFSKFSPGQQKDYKDYPPCALLTCLERKTLAEQEDYIDDLLRGLPFVVHQTYVSYPPCPADKDYNDHVYVGFAPTVAGKEHAIAFAEHINEMKYKSGNSVIGAATRNLNNISEESVEKTASEKTASSAKPFSASARSFSSTKSSTILASTTTAVFCSTRTTTDTSGAKLNMNTLNELETRVFGKIQEDYLVARLEALDVHLGASVGTLGERVERHVHTLALAFDEAP